MIQTFTISNFFSIREPLEVSFEASKEKQYGEDWIVQIGNVRLLKTLFLYGANGSGKTNILCALDFLRHLAISVPRDVDASFSYMRFALDPEYKGKETEFSVFFFINETRYSYSISLTPTQILNEELRVFSQGNSGRGIYSRKYDYEKARNIVKFGPWMGLSKDDRKSIEDATTNNISVLAAYSTRNVTCPELTKVREYFKYHFFKLYYLNDGDSEVAKAIKWDANLKTLLIELLKTFHSNIIDIQIEEETKSIPKEAKLFLEQIQPVSEEDKERIESIKSFKKITSKYIHKTALGEFSLDDSLQSEGTRAFIRHLTLFYKAIKGKWLLALDEFGSGMQAKTQNLLLDFFLKFSSGAQMIITTQSLGFLDFPSMRRDAIHIVSKDDLGQSHIDRDTVRTIHKNIKLRKAYIEGKFTTIDPNEPDIDFNEDRVKFQKLIFDETGKEDANGVE